MSFNLDVSKQAQVIFSRKQAKSVHPDQTHYQKHLGAYLDMKYSSKKIFDYNLSFVRPYLDYNDLIYDQPNNENFCQQIESVQYHASLAITGVIKGTSRLKLYNEIELESLKFR